MKNKNIKYGINSSRGQSVAELALVLPIFLTIVMCIIEFGFLMSNYVTVVNGAREGARYASLGSTDNKVVEIVKNVSPNLNGGAISVDITPSSRTSGDSVTVVVEYRAEPILPIFEGIIPQIYNVRSEMTMRVE